MSVYVSVPLHGSDSRRGRAICEEARREAERAGQRAAGVRLRVTCLDDTGGGGLWALSSVGANARRAVEDSSTVAYVGEPEPAAARFSAPILESAGIPQLTNMSGAEAISKLVHALREASGSSNLREALLDELR